LVVSLLLTLIAAAVLVLAVLPAQERLLAVTEDTVGPAGSAAEATRLSMFTGIFNLLWAVVVVLMIVRPGSTTGA
jgi:hypothetical protein